MGDVMAHYRSWASSAANRRSMLGNRARDTSPELQLRSVLHSRGLRFRKHCRPIPDLRCVADVVFPRQRVAVFLDGCFWHGCPEHFKLPRTNRAYWKAKIGGNEARDARNDQVLLEAGWLIVRAWEHDPVGEVADRVATALRGRIDEQKATGPALRPDAASRAKRQETSRALSR